MPSKSLIERRLSKKEGLPHVIRLIKMKVGSETKEDKSPLTNEELGEMMGVRTATISDWQRGMRQPIRIMKKELIKLCDQYNINIDQENN